MVKSRIWLPAKTVISLLLVQGYQQKNCQQKNQIQFKSKSLGDTQTTSLTKLPDKFLRAVFPKDVTVASTLLDMTGQHTTKMQTLSIRMHDPGPAHTYTHTHEHAHTQQIIRGDITTKAPAREHVRSFRWKSHCHQVGACVSVCNVHVFGSHSVKK